jgi:predicted DNA binding CopG/RHH family protein
MSKPLPKLATDEAAADFVETADLTAYDLTGMTPHSFEYDRKSQQVNIRFPAGLLDAVKVQAAARGMSYQRYIRHALEQTVRRAGNRADR